MCLQAMEKNIKKTLRKYLKRKRVGEKRLCNWRDKSVVGKRLYNWRGKSAVKKRTSYLER